MMDTSRRLSLSHLPTWFFIIGYPAFWLQMYTGQARQGWTSPLVWLLMALAAAVYLRPRHRDLSWFKDFVVFWRGLPALSKFIWTLAAGFVLVLAGITVLAAGQPLHLQQEGDCLLYHYTLPRQHLILGSFKHLPWSADDLFVLPVDFALAPFWFTTTFPNKLPQVFILFGLAAVGGRLTAALAGPGRPWAPLVFVAAFFGTHGFGIQMGTGMLDMTVAYLFLAGLDSLRRGQAWMAAVELAFFVWAKPFLPLEAALAFGLMAGLWALARWARFQTSTVVILPNWRRALVYWLLVSLPVAGPFVAKSIYYSGTPLFPFLPGFIGHPALALDPAVWSSVLKASQWCTSEIRNEYGQGRGLVDFIKHWWLIAVPTKGVVNAYDYPLGLSYLLLVGPFLLNVANDLRRRLWPPLSVLALLLWGLWWLSSQQSRFLFVPLLLIFILSIANLQRPFQALLVGLLAALAMNTVSVYNANKQDLFKPAWQVLRPVDRDLVELSRRYWRNPTGWVPRPWPDVAYAQFPVLVTNSDPPHDLWTPREKTGTVPVF